MNTWHSGFTSDNAPKSKSGGRENAEGARASCRWMCRGAIIVAVVYGCLLGARSFAGQGEEAPDARTVLERAAGQYAARPPVSFDCEAVVTWPDKEFEPGERTALRYVCRFVEDGDRIDLTKWTHETVEGEERLFKEFRCIWDGSRFLLRSKLPLVDHHNAYVSKDSSLRVAATLGDRKDACLDGTLRGFQGRHYAEALLDSGELRRREEMEAINGHPCYVVEASRREGESCTFWIDPAAGYNLRQAVVRWVMPKGQEPPKPTPGTERALITESSEYVVSDVKLEQIGGIWVAVAGMVEDRTVYTDGRSYYFKRRMRRRNIVWNPDLDRLGAFQMDLPEGAKISNQDAPEGQYVWLHGDVRAVRHLHDKMVGQPAPALEIERWYNTDSPQAGLTGKVVVLDFFGVWCRPCMAQIPFLRDLWKQHAPQGLVVVGVHTPLEKEGIPEFITQKEVGYPIAVDREGKTAERYGVYYYPTLVVIDRTGRVRSVNPEKDELSSLLKSLLDQ